MTSGRNYADSHRVVRISSKRFDSSPYVDRYANEETVFGVYAGRLYPLSLGADPVEDYRHLRRAAALFDVPERPLQVEGPDAERLLDLVLTRDVTTLPPGRACYAIACDDRGGILMDGVLIRRSSERFWYVLADGAFVPWLRAHASGMDVAIADPDSWVMQVQGPTSLDVLDEACDGGIPDPFPYFAVTETNMGGRSVLVSRTGWSGELGFEVYTQPGLDGATLWDQLVEAGSAHGLAVQSLESLGIRRIEAGILDNGSDMDQDTTPFAAGLGRFVDLDKADFIGKDALTSADRRTRLFGIVGGSTPDVGAALHVGGSEVGIVTAGAWSPSLERGIGYGRMREAGDWVGTQVQTGRGEPFEVVALPFLDPDRTIPRGLAT